MALAGIGPTLVFLESPAYDTETKATTVTPGTGKIHVTETLAPQKITTLGSAGSVTIVDGVVTAATAPS